MIEIFLTNKKRLPDNVRVYEYTLAEVVLASAIYPITSPFTYKKSIPCKICSF